MPPRLWLPAPVASTSESLACSAAPIGMLPALLVLPPDAADEKARVDRRSMSLLLEPEPASLLAEPVMSWSWISWRGCSLKAHGENLVETDRFFAVSSSVKQAEARYTRTTRFSKSTAEIASCTPVASAAPARAEKLTRSLV